MTACEADFTQAYVAIRAAAMDWRARGQSSEIARREKQARALREALPVLREYQTILEANLEAVRPEGTHWTPAPMDGVEAVIGQLAKDLVTRNPQGMASRKDRSLFYCLGRAFAKAGLKRPPVAALRALGEAINPDSIAGGDPEDANILHTFNAGYKVGLRISHLTNCMLPPK